MNKKQSLISIFLMLPLVACSLSEPAVNDAILEQETEISVNAWSERQFFLEYGEAFSLVNPTITLQVVPQEILYQEESNYKDQVLQSNIDVIRMNFAEYKQLTEDQLLVPINSFMQRDQLSLDEFAPIVADSLRQSE